MLKLRLQRTGRKHEPMFRVVLTDSKNSTKSGRFLEILGSFDGRGKDFQTLNVEKVKEWLSKGVQLTPRLHNMFIDKKIISGKKINVLPRKSPITKEAAPEAQTPGTEKAKETPAESVEEKKEEVKEETVA